MSDCRIAYDACPLCDSKDVRQLGVGSCAQHPLFIEEISKEIFWMRCHDCDHAFTSGYFTDDVFNKLLKNAHPEQLPGTPTLNERAIAAKIVEDVCLARNKWSGSWLDVGIGNGSLLATADEFGFDAFGIDVREKSVTRMHELHYDALCVGFMDLTGAGTFDVISMADVLEHMPFPRLALQKASELLREGGTLFLSMPNAESLAWRMMTATHQNPYWGEIEHYHNFGRSRLYELLDDFGFEPVRYNVSQRYVACMEVIARKIT